MSMRSEHENGLSEEEMGALSSFQNSECRGVASLSFVKVGDYTTFSAEYAFDGDDIILHFYRAPEYVGDGYWLRTFPAVLEPVAMEFFDARSPKLVAAFTDEMDSWWLRARGYDNILDKNMYVQKFLEKMDQALETTIST